MQNACMRKMGVVLYLFTKNIHTMATKVITTNGKGAATQHEDPFVGGTAADFKKDLNPETEFEAVEGLNLNLKNPDAEASNLSSHETGLLANAFMEMGDAGSGSLVETSDEFLPDAIWGSYAAPSREALEVIIGSDERIRINGTTTYPWRAICGLKITAANGKRFIGTGWLISPRTVVTAGHCVYMHNEGGWASSIEVIPGLNDAARPYGSFSSNVLRSVTGWTQGKKRENDYGCIILPQNQRPGSTVGFFGFAIRDDSFLNNAALNLSGYPGDKGGNQQWFMAQRPKSLSSRVITYNIDTMGGQSGSPVWVLQNGNRYAVGIHTNGHGTGNSATRIQTDVYNNLVNWKALGA